MGEAAPVAVAALACGFACMRGTAASARSAVSCRACPGESLAELLLPAGSVSATAGVLRLGLQGQAPAADA